MSTPGRTIRPASTLDGGGILPGFALPLVDLCADLDRRVPG